MTQNYPTNGTGWVADPAAREPGELLDRVCDTALRFLADIARPPRNLRIRAGEVSVDIEWAGEHAVAAEGTRSAPAAPVAAPATDPEPSGGYLTAQTVGVFYCAPEPGAAPFVSEGDTVIAGQQVGIIEAMKLMIPVEADRVGRITAVLKADAEPVEYGDRLFALATADAA